MRFRSNEQSAQIHQRKFDDGKCLGEINNTKVFALKLKTGFILQLCYISMLLKAR